MQTNLSKLIWQQSGSNSMSTTNTQSSHSEKTCQKIKEVVDESIKEANKSEKRRTYLGASSLGDPCSRKIQYRFIGQESDKESEFSAKLLRIFQFGHTIEDMAHGWLIKAGFDLRSTDKNGEQFGFSIADDQVKGHIDGVICGGPDDIKYPMLWECKSGNDKSFNEFVRKGVKEVNLTYASQIALYQAYMNLTENPALFTVVNKNNCEIYYELVPFDKVLAQKTSDKAVEILTAVKHNEILPRVATNSDYFLCKRCEFKSSCWVKPEQV